MRLGRRPENLFRKQARRTDLPSLRIGTVCEVPHGKEQSRWSAGGSGPSCGSVVCAENHARNGYQKKTAAKVPLVRVRSAILPTLQQLDAEIAALTMPI